MSIRIPYCRNLISRAAVGGLDRQSLGHRNSPRQTFTAKIVVLMTRRSMFLAQTGPERPRIGLLLRFLRRSSPKSRSRQDQLLPLVFEREHQDAVEIDRFEAHGRDVVLNRGVDNAAGAL